MKAQVYYYDEVESTNDVAMRLAAEGCPHGTAVVADRQSRGRGRLGRKWSSPPGSNIYMSVVLRPDLPSEDVTLLTLASAVASAIAIRETTGCGVSIKWPNDLMSNGRKLGGILLESRSGGARVDFAVLGIGINVNMTPSVPGATSVREETGKMHERAPLIEGILKNLAVELEILKKRGHAALLEKWKALSSTLGKDVRVVTANDAITGTAIDIDEKGRLILRTSANTFRIISSGDLTMLRAKG
jgi:BirA family biotin operon repressor/biotin-[acetyl-CoA-carboxylase] ligase